MRCEECGAVADEQARGWRAQIGEEDDGTLMVAVFCPECAEWEFGRLRAHDAKAVRRIVRFCASA